VAFFHCSFRLHVCPIDRAAVEPIIGQGIDRLPGNTIVLKFDVRPDPIWKAVIIIVDCGLQWVRLSFH